MEAIINEGAQSERRHAIEGELSALQGELLTVSDLMEKTYDMLEQKVAVAFVTRKLAELEERRAAIGGLIEVKSAEREELISRQVRYSRSKEEIRQLVERLQSPANEELFKLRAQIASQLKVLVETLLVGSLGERPRMLATIEKLRNAPGWESQDVISHMEKVAALPEQSRRFFAVSFRDSNVRAVYPHDDDPLRYQQQIVASEAKGFEVSYPDGD
ncbi:hypothetical protein ACFIOY_05815 [Bradyrhizobium sp. TZ2]